MIRLCGSAKRFPGWPAARRTAAMLAAIPTQIVLTGARTSCIVS